MPDEELRRPGHGPLQVGRKKVKGKQMKTLKDKVRDLMAAGITDYRKVLTTLRERWPRNRKLPSFETVQRYCRELSKTD